MLWKASVLLVTHVTDCPFYFCMKKKHILPAILHKLYQQPFFTEYKNHIFCMKTFSKYICCLKSLVGLRQTHACYFQRAKKAAPAVQGWEVTRRGIFLSTLFITSVIRNNADIFFFSVFLSVRSLHRPTVTVCTFLRQ